MPSVVKGRVVIESSHIFSRVRSDFDVATNRLIGIHGYCTQVSKGVDWILETACLRNATK